MIHADRAALQRKVITEAAPIIAEALADTAHLAALTFIYADHGVTVRPTHATSIPDEALELMIEAFTRAGWGFHTRRAVPEDIRPVSQGTGYAWAITSVRCSGITLEAPHTLTRIC